MTDGREEVIVQVVQFLQELAECCGPQDNRCEQAISMLNTGNPSRAIERMEAHIKYCSQIARDHPQLLATEWTIPIETANKMISEAQRSIVELQHWIEILKN